jgi:hypothetical protein
VAGKDAGPAIGPAGEDKHLRWVAAVLAARLPAGAVRYDRGAVAVATADGFRLRLFRRGQYGLWPVVATVWGEPADGPTADALARANAATEGLLRRALERSGGAAEAELARRVGRASAVRRGQG